MPARYNGLSRIMAAVTGSVFLQVIPHIYLHTEHNSVGPSGFGLCLPGLSVGTDPMQELFWFVYSEHYPTQNVQLL